METMKHGSQFGQAGAEGAPSAAQAPSGYPQPGFSGRIDDPEIKAALAKNSRAAGKFMLLLLPLPIIGFPIYALVTKDMGLTQALLAGGALSAIFLIINLVSKSKHSAKNTYDATVIAKRHDTNRTDDSEQSAYRTIVRTAQGRKKTIVETSNPPKSAFEYLRIGDRFRYHPQLAFPYEKFDKTGDGFVYCVCCTEKNDLRSDRCCKCGVPLLK